ncbi:serine/threonine-protein kinase [Sorangium cellulosum]|uniref:Protein kinase n=1 Tax=Sorangium cellulosum So0157-2 TaxID=1254432 RepID=S4XZM8_SORCE|nr:serine/threonine-protein kinase [Sorangium cellulosum]AGP37934.1 protein kinase [Sorangium cellulosum So0157-2]
MFQPSSFDPQPDSQRRDGARAAAALADRPADSRPASSRRAGRLRGRLVGGRYRLEHPLGRGAMGEVWRAHDSVRRADVALKFLVVARSGRNVDAIERFRLEARVAARLGQKTGGVVAVHDAGEDPAAGPYLVMEYVRGRSLRQLLDERGKMPAVELAALLRQLGEALSVAHGLGIVHRDVKPSNILLVEGSDGHLCTKITDFGIATWVGQDRPTDFRRRTADGVVLGTPAYLSPEHTCDGQAGPQLDLWSLAVVAHEALTGQQPFPGRNLAAVLASILVGARPPVTTLCPEAPPALEAWFARAFAIAPSERFPSVEAMIAAFAAAAGAPAASPAASRARPRRGRLAAAGAAAAVGAALAGGLLWEGTGAAGARDSVEEAIRAAGRAVHAAQAATTRLLQRRGADP